MTARPLIIVAALLAASCGRDSPSTPTTDGSQGFLAGTWTGTVSLHREGEADTVAPTTWTFVLLPNTGGTSYATTIELRDRWLPITAQVHAAVSPPAPGGAIGISGVYPSPRGCEGHLGSLGTAHERRIEATFHGVDCLQLPATSVFDGTVVLTR